MEKVMEALSVKTNREQWEERVEQWEASGLPVMAWCIERQVKYKTFLYWRRRLRTNTPIKQSLDYTFVELKDKSDPSSGIEIHHKKLIFSLSKGFDETALFRCLQVLEKL